MTALQLALPAVALLLLGAHFYRSAQFVPMAVALLLVALVLVRRPWAARVLQAALVLGALEWVRSTLLLVDVRAAAGEPYLRLTVILGAVALVTALAALVLQARRMRRWFGFADDAPGS